MQILVTPASQVSLWCACGRADIHARGLCPSCYGAWQRSRTQFGGLREQALLRDGKQCSVCGEYERRQILVHHRQPGKNRLQAFITLCRRCHPRVHSTLHLPFGFPEKLRLLWREQHPRLAEQLDLALSAEPGEPNGVMQVSLFEDLKQR